MAAAVAPALLPSLDPLHLNDVTAVARKRRREILTTQRLVGLPEVDSDEIRSDEPLLKIRRVSSSDDADSDSSKSDEKKTQMKYDPPPNLQMTKEETAAWRREQRRKRNRESAAASRQRQRDRIVELEEELEQWKAKFSSLAAKIEQLEKAVPKTTLVVSVTPTSADLSVVSPSTSPRLAPCVSPVSSQSLFETGMVSPDGASIVKEEAGEELSKLIPRQAVKITGVNPLPLLEDDDDDMMLPDALCPELCLSTNDIQLDPIDSNLLPSLDADVIPNLLSDREDESELGEFLLDAVQWL